MSGLASNFSQSEIKIIVDSQCSRLIENYKLLIKRSEIVDHSIQQHEQLQLSTSVQSIVRYTRRTILYLLFVNYFTGRVKVVNDYWSL